MPIESLPRESFRSGRLLRDGVWVVAFLAEWCPFCQRFFPEFLALDGGNSFRTAVGDVTSEESPLWDEFHIDVVPLVVVFRDGQPTFRWESELGLGLPPGELSRVVSSALDAPPP